MQILQLRWDPDTSLPVSLQRIKDMIRVDGEHFDDILASVHIPAAARWAEGFMHRSILSKVHYMVIDQFPSGAIFLPRGKTQSVASIEYYSNNSLITLTGPSSSSPGGTDWREDLGGDYGATLLPPYTGAWPVADRDNPAPVTITFTAGWTAGNIPGHIQQSIALYCDDALANETNSGKERLITGMRILSK